MDRCAVSLILNKEVIWTTWYEDILNFDVFFKAVYIASLTDGSNSIDEVFKRLKLKFNTNNIYDPKCYEVLEIVDEIVTVDLDRRTIYFGVDKDCDFWPLLDIKKLSDILLSNDYYSIHNWLYRKKLLFDDIDKTKVLEQFDYD